MTIETNETVSGEVMALMEVLKIHAPGVKWTYALVGNFERALLKRGYVLSPLESEAVINDHPLFTHKSRNR